MFEIPMFCAIGTVLFTGGVAFGGVKVALNGTRERIKLVEVGYADHSDRLARIETKVDLILDCMDKRD